MGAESAPFAANMRVDADEAEPAALRTACAHDVERRRFQRAQGLRSVRPSGFDVLAVTDHVTRAGDHVNAQRFDAYLAEIEQEAARAARLYGLLVLPGPAGASR